MIRNKLFRIIALCIIYMIFILNFSIIAQNTTDTNNNIMNNETEQTEVGPKADKNIEESEENQNIQSDKTSSIQEKRVNISVSAGISIMRGHTTYQIGGSVETPEESGEIHFPLSELIFPLNTYMISLETNILFLEKWKTDIKIQTNIKEDTDNMKDSDWGVPFQDPPNSGIYYWYGPDHLDIYSESETDLRAFIFDIDFLYRFFRYIPKGSSSADLRFFAGLGYIYQQYEFECRLIQQWDYREDNPNPQNAIGDGRIGLTYDVFTHIPYIKINSEIIFKSKYFIIVSIAYSPYVILEDKDNHILRSKKSNAECNGYAVLLSLAGKINLPKSVFIKIQLDYVSINTEGKEKQYEYGIWTATIDQKNFSKRKSAELSIGYNF